MTHIMIGTSMTTKYFAEYVESGTNYRLQTDKYDTYEEALKATRKGMYPANPESINVYRINNV